VCLFGEDKIAADLCTFDDLNKTFTMHTPYGMTLDTCPIIITLTTVGESYASKKGFLLDHAKPGEVKTNT
jgi:hypothetical protein